jgi:hypothetical protein
MYLVDSRKAIKNHNKGVIDAAEYYAKNKSKERIDKINQHTEKTLAESMRYFRDKKNVTQAEAEAVIEKIARHYRK